MRFLLAKTGCRCAATLLVVLVVRAGLFRAVFARPPAAALSMQGS